MTSEESTFTGTFRFISDGASRYPLTMWASRKLVPSVVVSSALMLK